MLVLILHTIYWKFFKCHILRCVYLKEVLKSCLFTRRNSPATVIFAKSPAFWKFACNRLTQTLTPLKRLSRSPARLLATPNMAATKSVEDPYAIHNDGSAKDPAAFQQALRADESKMKDLQSEPEVIKIVLGQDLQAFQELLKTVYAV